MLIGKLSPKLVRNCHWLTAISEPNTHGELYCEM